MLSATLRCSSATRLLTVLLALGVVAAASACSTTKFPEAPEAHRLYEELEAAPDAYYFLVRTGVRSRVLGLPEDTARAALRAVKGRWDAFDPLSTTDALLSELQAEGPRALASPIRATLAQNARNRPEGGADAALEAGALKQGLIEAYYEL